MKKRIIWKTIAYVKEGAVLKSKSIFLSLFFADEVKFHPAKGYKKLRIIIEE